DSRPARPPHWWEACDVAGDAGVSARATEDGRSTAQAYGRILFLRDDPVARAIAERVTALARGRAPAWLASRLAFDGAPTAVGVGRAELRAALEDGSAGAIVTRLNRVEHGGCDAGSVQEPGPLPSRWHVTPLIDTRDALIHRPGIG